MPISDGWRKMTSPLRNLIGWRVAKTVSVYDYVQLIMLDGAILTICNEFKVGGGNDFDGLVGRKLIDISETVEEVQFCFEHETSLTVNLRPEAYHGPEAMVLHRKGEPIVVWN